MAAADYRFWVRAYNSETGAFGRWSDPMDFTVPAPVVTGPISPVVSTRHPEITWTEVDTAVSYDVWVNNLTTDESQIIRSTNQLDTTYDLNDYLIENHTTGLVNADYRVWVRAFDPTGVVTHWSAAYDFTVAVPQPTPPTLIAPNNSGTVGGLPVFTWTSVAGADHYEILVKERIGSSTDGQPITIDVRNVPENTFTPTSPLEPGNYRWWVRAVNNVGLIPSDFSDYSAPLDFTVAAVDAPSQATTTGPDQVELQSTGPVEAADAVAVTAVPSVLAPTDTKPQLPVQPLGHPVSAANQAPPTASTTTVDVTSVPSDDMDAVMTSWPEFDWWDAATHHDAVATPKPTRPDHAIIESDPPAAPDRHLLASSAPLVALAAWQRKRRARDQRD
jgi:hypothetical protein